jgi:hypothetical protein
MHGCLAEEILELSRSFIEQHKNKLTIDVMYIVDAAHKKPNPPGKDGDMHVAGRAAEIGLATVAEIQNADAVNRVRGVEGSGQAIALSGVWRIWPEHGGDNSHIQQTGPGSPFEGMGPTNPPHVFEIHPISKIEQQDLSSTFRPIPGFTPKEAEDAFARYERGTFEITTAGDCPNADADGRLQLRQVRLRRRAQGMWRRIGPGPRLRRNRVLDVESDAEEPVAATKTSDLRSSNIVLPLRLIRRFHRVRSSERGELAAQLGDLLGELRDLFVDSLLKHAISSPNMRQIYPTASSRAGLQIPPPAGLINARVGGPLRRQPGKHLLVMSFTGFDPGCVKTH